MSAPDRPDLAIVTGAGAGLGATIAERLHDAGFRVVVADADEARAAEVANRLDRDGRSALCVHLDVTDAPAIEALAAWLDAEHGGAQVLVNNAAVTRATPVLDISIKEFDAVMAVNVRGAFAASQAFGRRFKAAGYGRIVNMASLAGQNGGTATGAHYAASKGALITLTKVFARDLAPFGVTVNAVAPGPVDGPTVQRLVGPEQLPAMLHSIPVGRLGEPEFIAGMVALLASRASGFVTGATWDVNGGLFMR